MVSALAAEFDRAQAPRVELTASAETKPFVFAPAGGGGAGGGGAVLARPDAAGVAAAAVGGGFGGGFVANGGRQGAAAGGGKGGAEVEMETETDGGGEGGAEGAEGEGLAEKARRQQKEKKIPRKQMLKARLARQQDLSDEADRFNPQANRAIKKQQKNAQKKGRRNDMSRMLVATAAR